MTYRPDIDGLRAIAVLSVVFYHAQLGFRGGYVGVDIFFVISGYLITGLILKSLKEGNFTYIDFWERRVRRLVPALAVVTLFTAATGYLLLLPSHLVDLGGALIAQPLLLVNVYFWRVVKNGYFGDPPENRPLLHTWSLGVEEQFYVFFPLLLMFLWKRQVLRNHLGKVFVAVALVSLALGAALTPIKCAAAFFNLPTRAWELLLGALLHYLPAPKPGRIPTVVAYSGLVLVAYAIFFFTDDTPFPGTAALVPTVGTAMLIWSENRGLGWLSASFIVLIGQISYSLYLWHWPIMAYGNYLGLTGSLEAKVLVVLLSLLLGYLSWNWVETPIRTKRLAGSRLALGGVMVTYILGSCAIGTTFRVREGFPESWGPRPSILPIHSQMVYRTFGHETDPRSPTPELRVIGNPARTGPAFLLWGDSHAMSLGAVFNVLGKEYRVQGLQLTASGSPPLIRVSSLKYSRREPAYLSAVVKHLPTKNLRTGRDGPC